MRVEDEGGMKMDLNTNGGNTDQVGEKRGNFIVCGLGSGIV